MSKTTKYYLNKEIKLIVERVFYIKRLFTILNNLKPNKDYPYIHVKLPYIMTVIENTLIDKILLELSCTIIDKDKEDLCIPWLIRKYENNKTKFKVKEYIYIKSIDDDRRHKLKINKDVNLENEFNSLKAFLLSNQKIMDFLKKYRDKQLAHHDKKLFFNKNNIYPELKVKITYEELEKFINELFIHINTIYLALSGIQYADGELGLDEIKYLNSLLCNDHKRRNSKTTR